MKKLKDILEIAIFITMLSFVRFGKNSPDNVADKVASALILPTLPLIGMFSPLLFHISAGQAIGLCIIILVTVYIPFLVYIVIKDPCSRIYEKYRNSKYASTKYLVLHWIYFLSSPIVIFIWGIMLKLTR